jgi:hypothetical protein
MKSILFHTIPVLIILAACVGIPAPTTPASPNPAQTVTFPPAETEQDFTVFEPGLILSQQAVLQNLTGASIYDIDYTINSDLASLSGQQRVHYTNQEDLELEEIAVRLLPNVLNGQMDVSLVMVDQKPVNVRYALNNSLMTIPLEEELSPGESVDLEFNFTIQLPTELESNYGILAYYNGVLTLAHCYAMIAVYDDEGWNAEIPPDQGDPTYADVSFFVVSVDAPGDLVLVGSGQQVSREEFGDRQQVIFAAGPARDFYLAASPDYQVLSKSTAGVTFNSYAPEGFEAGAQAALEYAIAAVQIFSQRYSPYPYTEFDIVATPTYALGVEYPGIVAITDRLYDLSGSLSGTSNQALMESVVVHEAGHQWFYNMVGNDQLDEPWLDESLTQFVTWQYYADRYGQVAANGFESSLRSRWSRVNNQPIPIGLPVSDYQGAAYGAIVYGRGAFFFKALREELGEEHFDAFMQAYSHQNAWGIATGQGLKSLAETYCACDLSELFAQWVSP